MQYVSELFAAIQNWLKQSGLIPLSAIVTVILFVTREILDSRRKKHARTNEIRALKRILARECELNWYLSNQISDICSIFKLTKHNGYQLYNLELTQTPSRKTRFEIIGYEYNKGKGVLFEPQVVTFKEYLYEVVKVDVVFYERVEPAYEAALELKQLRDSLVDIANTDEWVDNDSMMLDFSEYANKEIKSINKRLKILYQFCTGKELSLDLVTNKNQ